MTWYIGVPGGVKWFKTDVASTDPAAAGGTPWTNVDVEAGLQPLVYYDAVEDKFVVQHGGVAEADGVYTLGTALNYQLTGAFSSSSSSSSSSHSSSSSSSSFSSSSSSQSSSSSWSMSSSSSSDSSSSSSSSSSSYTGAYWGVVRWSTTGCADSEMGTLNSGQFACWGDPLTGMWPRLIPNECTYIESGYWAGSYLKMYECHRAGGFDWEVYPNQPCFC